MLSNVKEKNSEFFHRSLNTTTFTTTAGFDTFQRFAGYRNTKFLHCYVANKEKEE